MPGPQDGELKATHFPGPSFDFHAIGVPFGLREHSVQLPSLCVSPFVSSSPGGHVVTVNTAQSSAFSAPENVPAMHGVQVASSAALVDAV